MDLSARRSISNKVMEISDVVVTKPGGITTAECLCKQVPMIIINPIPGQEQKNTDFLLGHGVAVRAERSVDVVNYVDEFLHNPEKLRRMRDAAAKFSRPSSSLDAARAIIHHRQTNLTNPPSSPASARHSSLVSQPSESHHEHTPHKRTAPQKRIPCNNRQGRTCRSPVCHPRPQCQGHARLRVRMV